MSRSDDFAEPDKGYYVRETQQDGVSYTIAYFPGINGKRVVCAFRDEHNKQLVEAMFVELMKWRALATGKADG